MFSLYSGGGSWGPPRTLQLRAGQGGVCLNGTGIWPPISDLMLGEGFPRMACLQEIWQLSLLPCGSPELGVHGSDGGTEARLLDFGFLSWKDLTAVGHVPRVQQKGSVFTSLN